MPVTSPFFEKMFCSSYLKGSKPDIIDDGKFVNYPLRIGKFPSTVDPRNRGSILLCGKRQSYFPFQCFVGPDWPMLILVYSLILIANGTMLPYVVVLGLPFLLVGLLGFFSLVYFYTAVACSNPGIIFDEQFDSDDDEENNINEVSIELNYMTSQESEDISSRSFIDSSNTANSSIVFNPISLGSTTSVLNESFNPPTVVNISKINSTVPKKEINRMLLSRAYLRHSDIDSDEESDELNNSALHHTNDPQIINNIDSEINKQQISSSSSSAHTSIDYTESKDDSSLEHLSPTNLNNPHQISYIEVNTQSNHDNTTAFGKKNCVQHNRIDCTSCGICDVKRPLSANHCHDCGVCVDELDHHCPWCGKCIGKENIFYFKAFISLLCFQIFFLAASFFLYSIYPNGVV